MPQALEFKPGQLDHPQVQALLAVHLADIAPTAPAESRHALDLSGLQAPEVCFWSAWQRDSLAAVGAYKQLSPMQAEIKSMCVAKACRAQGAGRAMLQFLAKTAQEHAITELYLETGSMAFFLPARKLYESFGFEYCPPFGDYRRDPNSVFMRLSL
jgi:putative acetyltransferase